jgi:actin-like ATPase involved in cell morphogenesis
MYGLDIGTATIILAKQEGKTISYSSQRDVFFTIKLNNFNKAIYKKQMDSAQVNYIINDNNLIVIGNHALELASAHNKEIRRPMAGGILNPKEQDNINILESILKSIVGHPDKNLEHSKMCFSVPAKPYKNYYDIVFHESVCKDLITKMGYEAVPINEAMAIIYAECEDTDFTGVALSCGGGLTNVCISKLASPIAEFSIEGAGDSIDAGISRSLNISKAEACLLKETEGNLTKEDTRENKAINSYYRNYIVNTLSNISDYIYTNNLRFKESLNLGLSGGTASIIGFKELFEEELNKTNMNGLVINEVILPKDPIKTVARGLLTASLV